MHFDMADNKPSTLNQIQCKPLRFPSRTVWQTEAEGTIKKLQQVLIQGHTVCMRHLHQGITF